MKTTIKLKNYKEQEKEWPQKGYHIMAQYSEEEIIVYQSYRPEIGNFAAQNQYFGGAFSLNRMTWIKPNFLWMMYRNGWGKKKGQEVVLAIHLKRTAFERYLKQAVYSSFQPELYTSREDWRAQLDASNVRLQWDSDHDIYGEDLERRAIQIGIKGEQIANYAKEDVLAIVDISSFVATQYDLIQEGKIDELLVPEEKPLWLEDEQLNQHLRIK